MLEYKSRILVLFYLLGFFLGIVYMNVISRDYISAIGIFASGFTEQFIESDITDSSYLWYLVKLRALPALILSVAGTTRIRKISVAAFLIWTGLLCGVCFTSAVIGRGLTGILICLVSQLPHIGCYLFAYGILLMTIYFYPKKQWNYEKTIAFCLAICMGIALEYKANPILVKMILKRI